MPPLVLHILSSSGQEGTGIARLVSSLHRYISPEKYGMQACFVGSPGPLVEVLAGEGIPSRVVPWQHPSRDPIGLLRLLRHIRMVRPDILHFHWGGAHIRRFTGRFSGAKIVQHLHSSIDESDQSRDHKLSTEGSEAVIAISRAVAIQSLHPHTRLIYSGVEIPGPLAHAEPNKIGSAGRLTSFKGISHLLKSMSLLKADFPALRLEIAGDGPERSHLESLSISLDLQASVTFKGWIQPLDLKLLGWAMLIQPSLAEGLSLTVLEAMAAGLPVVATRIGGLPELVEDGQTGLLVPAEDSGALANAIRRLLVDPALAVRMGAAGRVRVEERFQARRMAAQVEALYDELFAK